ncbi:hypothetical protein PPACK8108_LOCUS10128 [Phakopsora pachyrhizi]|uniref:Uncharacterized protein n=1 Tax=Phakopsora pachyrhizi TaxID=170000 RepID=A0AAV0AZK5_PHAPC|nr:hypothetical protein PPACK8108_LOCUS10128 [Phakopsora pachyrhizi]
MNPATLWLATISPINAASFTTTLHPFGYFGDFKIIPLLNTSSSSTNLERILLIVIISGCFGAGIIPTRQSHDTNRKLLVISPIFELGGDGANARLTSLLAFQWKSSLIIDSVSRRATESRSVVLVLFFST